MFSIKTDQQLTLTDSGISTIKTVCDIYGKPITRQYIAQQTQRNEKGVGFSDVKTFFEKNGFTTKSEIFSEIDLDTYKNELPFIVPVKSKKAYEYLIVIVIKKHKLKVSNSKTGEQYYLPIAEFKDVIKLTKSEIDTTSLDKRFYQYCKNTISKYHLDLHVFLRKTDIITLASKVKYFNYINQKFGFKSALAEKGYLEELLEDTNFKVPDQFQDIYEGNTQPQSKLPIILIPKPSKGVIVSQDIKAISTEKKSMYWQLFKQLKAQKNMWYMYVFITFFSAMITQLSVFINQILIDHVLPTFNISTLVLFAIGLSVYKLFDLFTKTYKKFVGIHLKNALDLFFLKEFDSKINRFSLSYIQSFKKGDLLERVSDALKLKRFFIKFFTAILIDLVVSIYSLFILFYIHWKLTLALSFAMVLFYSWFKIITPYLKQNEKVRYTRKANYLSKVIEKIEGIQVLKSFGSEVYFSHKIMASADSYLKIQLKSQYVNLINTIIVSMLMVSISIAVIIVLAKSAILYQMVTLGQIITYIALSSKIFGSVKRILNQNLTLQENQIILKRFLDFNEEQNIIKVDKGDVNFNIESITLNGIDFKYGNNLILNDLNFLIHKGEKIKIEGCNGSGKSTLCKVLTTIITPTSGEILINNNGVNLYNAESYRKKIALSTNEDIVFNDTILENITLGRNVPLHTVFNLAKQVGFYEFLNKTKGGLNFKINENGKNLSTGQRKKILLLRAFLSSAEILILDEVLSGIDIVSRKKIEAYINKSSKTIIVITHEPTMHINFSKTYKLKDAKLNAIS
ncbi:hypothetical protein MHTCC0001_24050 [Flavobacteriaceae bacterium MHTCC 0001]